MSWSRRWRLARVLELLAGVLVLRVVASVVANYPDYIPPDFSAEFLRGRERLFGSWYRWAFQIHIVSGPAALVLGLGLVSVDARRRFPQWHRRLGWIQVVGVLALVAPSGLAMAWYAASGPVGGAGLAALAAATATCTVVGASAAIRRRFVEHRRWMWRSYLLLTSAVVLRLIGGLATVASWHAPWLDPLAAWACWVVPLMVFEIRERGVATASRSV